MAGGNATFHAEPTGMLRVPLLPRAAAATRADIDPRDREQVRRYIDSLLSDGRVEEALAVSSPSLRRAIETLRAGAPMKPNALRKLTLSAARYVLRGASRATPFGLLAGIAPVSFGEGCRVRMGTRHRKAVRPDGGWLTGVLAAWEGDLDVLRGLRVVTNDLGFARGQRWVLPVAYDAKDHDGLALPRRRVPEHPRIVQGGASPRAGPQGLPPHRTAPPRSETDPLRYAVDVLETLGRAEAAGELAAIGALLEEYGTERLGAGLGRWHTAVCRGTPRCLWCEPCFRCDPGRCAPGATPRRGRPGRGRGGGLGPPPAAGGRPPSCPSPGW